MIGESVAWISFDGLFEGNVLWVGEGDGDGDGDGERLNKLLIGSAVGNVSLIWGDFLAGGVGGVDAVSSISNSDLQFATVVCAHENKAKQKAIE